MNRSEQFAGQTVKSIKNRYLHTKWSLRQFKRELPIIAPTLPKHLATTSIKSSVCTATALIVGGDPLNSSNILLNFGIAGSIAYVLNHKLLHRLTSPKFHLEPKTRAYEAQDIVDGTETGLMIINSLALFEMLSLNLDILQKTLGLAALGIINTAIYFDSLRRAQKLRKYDGPFIDRG